MLKKTIVILLGLILLVYLSIPWIAKPLLKQSIPNNIELIDIEIGYPKFSGIRVNRAIVKIDDTTLEIGGFSSSYHFEKISIASLIINLPDSKQASNSTLSVPALPIFDPKDSLSILNDKSIDIARLTVKKSENWFLSEEIKISSQSDNSLSIKVSSIKSNLAEQLGDLTITLFPQEQALDFKFAIELKSNHFSGDGKYWLDKDGVGLDIGIDELSVNHLIPKTLSRFFAFNEPLTISIYQNLTKTPFWNVQELTKATLSGFAKTGFLELEEGVVGLELISKKETVSSDTFIGVKVDIKASKKQSNHKNATQKLHKKSIGSTIGFDLKKNALRGYLLDTFYSSTAFNNIDIPLDEYTVGLNAGRVVTKPTEILLADLFEGKSKLDLQGENLQFQVNKIDNNSQPKLLLASKSASIFTEITSPYELSVKSTATINQLNLEGIDTSNELNIELAINDLNLISKSGNFQLSLFDTEGSIQDIEYESLYIDVKGDFKDEQLLLEGNTVLDSELSIPIKANYSFESLSGKVSLIEKENSASAINGVVKQSIRDIFTDISFSDGKFKQSGTISFGEKIEGNLQLSIEKSNFSLDESQINKIDFLTNIEIADSSYTAVSNISFESINLSSGLDITDIEFSLSSTPKKSQITSLTAKLMEGELASDSFIIEDSLILPSQVSLKGISLFELISFLDVESLYADGTLDLSIPVMTEGQSIVVKEGSFKNTKSGVLKYNSEEDLSESGNIALKALQNFQYTELDGTIDYDAEGNYIVKIHILGSNPELYDGHPVDFNFNINGNLPGLFKSLFLSGNFEQSILDSLSKGILKTDEKSKEN